MVMCEEVGSKRGSQVDIGSVVGVEFKAPSREVPIAHPGVDAPLCEDCSLLDLAFFDPSCPGCLEILKSPTTSIPQIFAIMRQWVPQTQRNIELLINEILRRGGHVDDRDKLTDMTLLQYACKSGAPGVGDAEAATKVVKMLLELGADIHSRCTWTHMTALHYAAYFDVASVLELLLECYPGLDVNDRCYEYDNGTPLHISAGNLCISVVKLLLTYGANPNARDDLGRVPAECIPDKSRFDLIPDLQIKVETLSQLLWDKTVSQSKSSLRTSVPEVASGKAMLQGMGIKIGDRVYIGDKPGTIKFFGTTEFATGLWAGVEFDAPEGKNDGTVNGVIYFKSKPNHGIFTPLNSISKKICSSEFLNSSVRRSIHRSPVTKVHHGKVDVSHVKSKISTGLSGDIDISGLEIGEKILVASGGALRQGAIRYIGPVEFNVGTWIGVELDTPVGRHDGSVEGVRYFTCKPQHGLFTTPQKLKRQQFDDDENKESVGQPFTRTMSLRVRRGKESMPSRLKRSQSVRYHRESETARGQEKFVLEIGMTALYNHEIGIVRYIGPVDFAEGTWLGLELRRCKGNHSGSYEGKRYFHCKDGHGVFVRPKSVTVRGINASLLLDTQE